MPPDTTLPDAALLARIRAGDQPAFGELFRVWYPRLADYAASLTGARDAAEDVVQEVFVAVWGRREALPDAGAIPSYLHRAVRNRALNHLRQQRTRGRWLASQEPDPAIPPLAESAVIGAEMADRVRAALAALAPRTREVFLLSRDQGLTYPAIADTLGISVKTVETLMGRALRALREAVADDGGPPG